MCFSIPKFSGGAETLSELRSILHLVERSGGTNLFSFYRIVAYPDYEYSRLLDRFHQRRIEKIELLNDESAKLLQVWISFYERLNTARRMFISHYRFGGGDALRLELWRGKIALDRWIQSHHLAGAPSMLLRDTDVIFYIDSSTNPGALKNIWRGVESLYFRFLARVDFKNCSSRFIGKVQSDLRFLLTRIVGQDLIRAILQKPFHLKIRPWNINQLFFDKNEYVMTLSNREVSALNLTDEFRIRSFKTPTYVILAHELIHLYDGVYGILSAFASRDAVIPGYDTQAEELAIMGFTNGVLTVRSAWLNENAIRSSFGLSMRIRHDEGPEIGDFRSQVLNKMMQLGMKDEIKVFFGIIPEERLKEIVSSIPPGFWSRVRSILQEILVESLLEAPSP